jgi:hypothetical protein
MSDLVLPKGFIKGDQSEKIDKSQIVDVDGKPLKYGNTDKNIISADDNPKFKMRIASDFPDVPQEAKNAEVRYILPMANFIAQTLGINVIDEKMYESTLIQLKQRSLFVVMNLQKMQIQEGVAAWYGLLVMCKKHPLVMTKFKLQISTGKIGVSQCRLWEKSEQRYVIQGDPEQKKLKDREKTAQEILDYLKHEGVCNV